MIGHKPLTSPLRAAMEKLVTEPQPERKLTAHLLSCTNCRKRKVKCNKSTPCSACDRSSLVCVFPNRARLPRGRTGGSKATNIELLRRLNKLEELLEKANQEGKDDETKSPISSSSTRSGSGQVLDTAIAESPKEGVNTQIGGDRDLNRYIGSTFWRSLTRQVEGLRQILNEESDEDGDLLPTLETETSDSPITRSGTIMGYSTLQFGFQPYHPSQSHMLLLCAFYVDNVDPIFKVIHVPSLKKSVSDASHDLNNVLRNKSMEALFFAMYYAAITSLSTEQCETYFQENKSQLLAKYQVACKIAFANADILIGADLVLLQALVIFLICVRCQDDSQFAWTLVAVAIRIGHSLGLHRETLDSSFSPFTQELRRRLWWQICLLDIHASEDRGSDLMIFAPTFNTQIPLNINDADFGPENDDPLESRTGFTEMTFSIICYELSMAKRRLLCIPPSEEDYTSLAILNTFEEKKNMLLKCQQRLERTYLVHTNTGSPISWVSWMVARLVIAKAWLSIYHPLEPESRGQDRPLISRKQLLPISVEILEVAYRLEWEPSTAQWRWYLNTWVQWHALAVALAVLCVQNLGPLVERAWAIIDVVYELWAAHIADSSKGMLWRPIQKLMDKAQRNRQRGSLVDGIGAQVPILPQVQPSCPPEFQSSMLVPTSMRTNAEVPTNMIMQVQFSPNNQAFGDIAPKQTFSYFNSPQMFPTLAPQQQAPTPAYEQTLPGFTPQQTLPVFTPLVDAGDSLNNVAWDDWNEFVEDFEMENRPGQRNVPQDVKSFGNSWF